MISSVVIGLALAQSSTSWAEEDSEGLIRQGVQLRRRGEDAKAHGYFQRAYDVAPTPRTAAQLGLADLALGKWLDAEVRLTEALSSTDPWVEGHRVVIETSRTSARAKLGKIEITGAPGDARVEVTGRALTKLPADGAIWVSPGPVHVRVEAPGYRSATEDASVTAGGSERVHVTLARIATAPAPTVAATKETTGDVKVAARGDAPAAIAHTDDGQATDSGRAGATEAGTVTKTRDAGRTQDQEFHQRLRIASIAAVTVGVAAGVTGLVLRGIANKKADAILSDGTAGRPYNQANGDYQTFDRAGVGLLVGGVVVVGAGVVSYLLNRDKAAGEPGVSLNAGPGLLAVGFGGLY